MIVKKHLNLIKNQLINKLKHISGDFINEQTLMIKIDEE